MADIYAIRTDGINDRIVVSDAPAMATDCDYIWDGVYLTETTNQHSLFGGYVVDNPGRWQVAVHNGTLKFFSANTGDVLSSYTVEPNTPYTIRLSKRSNDYTLYDDVSGSIILTFSNGATLLPLNNLMGVENTGVVTFPTSADTTSFDYIDLITPSNNFNLDATASSHSPSAPNQPILVDTLGVVSTTGQNMAIDGSVWVYVDNDWAVLLDGASTGQILEFSTPTSYHQQLTNYVFESEYVIRSGASNSIYLCINETTGDGYISHQSAGIFRLRYGATNIEWPLPYTPDDNVINFIRVVRDGSSHELFLGGVSQGIRTTSATSSGLLYRVGGIAPSLFSRMALLRQTLWGNSAGTGDPLHNHDVSLTDIGVGQIQIADQGTVGNDLIASAQVPTDGSHLVNMSMFEIPQLPAEVPALQSDGVDSYLTLGNEWAPVADVSSRLYSISFGWLVEDSTDWQRVSNRYPSSSTDYNRRIIFHPQDGLFQLRTKVPGTENIIEWADLTFPTYGNYRLEVDSANDEVRLFINGVDYGPRTDASGFWPVRYLFTTSVGVAHTTGAMSYFNIEDETNPTNTLRLSALASDREITGVQPVLIDTYGTNDATGTNFATDGSVWLNSGDQTLVDLIIDSVVKQSIQSTLSFDITVQQAIDASLSIMTKDVTVQQSIQSLLEKDIVVSQSILSTITKDVTVQQAILVELSKYTTVQQAIHSTLFRDFVVQQAIGSAFTTIIKDIVVQQSIHATLDKDVVVNQAILSNLFRDVEVQQSIQQYLQKDNVVQQSIQIPLSKDYVVHQSILQLLQSDVVVQQSIHSPLVKDALVQQAIRAFLTKDTVVQQRIISDVLPEAFKTFLIELYPRFYDGAANLTNRTSNVQLHPRNFKNR